MDAASFIGRREPFGRGNHTILDTAVTFKEATAGCTQKLSVLGGRDLRQLVLRGFDPHQDQLFAGRPAAGGRHGRFFLLRQQSVEGRNLHRHGQEHRGHGDRRGDRAASHARHAATAGPEPELLGDQCRRRRPRASHAGPARHPVDSRAPRPDRGADRGAGRRHRPQPHGPIEHLGLAEARGPRDRVRSVHAGFAALGGIGRRSAPTTWTRSCRAATC